MANKLTASSVVVLCTFATAGEQCGAFNSRLCTLLLILVTCSKYTSKQHKEKQLEHIMQVAT
eukprot:19788-Heterococcus_DN1.PRE.1